MDIRSYMEQARTVIEAVLREHDLMGSVGVFQGPSSIGFHVRLSAFSSGRRDVQEVQRLGDVFKLRLAVPWCRVQLRSGVVLVQIPSPVRISIRGETLQGRGLLVPLGICEDEPAPGLADMVVGHDFGVYPHLAVIGPTGQGKTTAMQALVFHLVRQNPGLRLVMVDPKGELRSLAGLAGVWGVVGTEEAQAAVDWVRRLMLARMGQAQRRPSLILMVDDLYNLLRVVADDGQLAEQLGEITSLGRALAVRLIVGTQRLGEAGVGGAAVVGNMARLVLGAADRQEAALFTGRPDSGAETLHQPGEAILVAAGLRRLTISPVSAEAFARLPQYAGELAGWRVRPARLSSSKPEPSPVSASQKSGLPALTGPATAAEPPPNGHGPDSRGANTGTTASPAVDLDQPPARPFSRPPAEHEVAYLRAYARWQVGPDGKGPSENTLLELAGWPRSATTRVLLREVLQGLGVGE